MGKILFTVSILFSLYLEEIKNKIIDYKEKKLGKKYHRYKNQSKYEKLENVIFVIIFGFISMYKRNDLDTLFNLIYILISLLIIRIDIEIRIIPNELVLLLFGTAIINKIILGDINLFKSGFIAMLLIFVLIMLTTYLYKFLSGVVGIGGGDLKLSMAVGFAVGFEKLDIFLFSLLLCVIIYLVYGLFTKLLNSKSNFAMGPHIVMAFLFALNSEIIEVIIKKIIL